MPIKPKPDQLSRLPQYAQSYILSLERENGRLRQELYPDDAEPVWCFTGAGRPLLRGAPSSYDAVLLCRGLDNRSRNGFTVRLSKDDTAIEVIAGGSLVIEPIVANHVTLRITRD